MAGRKLSDLEVVVLGVVSVYGPCTAYRIRHFFQGSPSSQFSGSSGTIYPLLRRLEKEGVVRSEAFERGKRAGRNYSITRTGMRALQGWMRGPFPPADFFSHDPFRTRSLFLDQLPREERLRWIEDAQASLDAQDQAIDARRERFRNDPWASIADDNARSLNAARRAWLKRMRENLPD